MIYRWTFFFFPTEFWRWVIFWKISHHDYLLNSKTLASLFTRLVRLIPGRQCGRSYPCLALGVSWLVSSSVTYLLRMQCLPNCLISCQMNWWSWHPSCLDLVAKASSVRLKATSGFFWVWTGGNSAVITLRIPLGIYWIILDAFYDAFLNDFCNMAEKSNYD